MDTAELRTFLIVAELGSFSRASVRLGVPQPTLSRQIGRLEEELGSPLFYRHGRGVSLTDLGRQLSADTGPLVRSLDGIRNEILAQSGQPSGLVRFGIPPSIGRSMAASVVSSFRARCPLAHLHVMEAFSGTLAEWLEAGTVDVAILYDERRSASMTVSPLLREDLFLMGRPGSVPDADPISIGDIDTSRLILPGNGEALRRAIDAGFEAAGISFDSSLDIDSIATMKLLAEAEDLLAILPYGAALREIGDDRLVARRIDSPEMTALLVVGTAASKPITIATRQLLKILKEQVAEFVAQGLLRGSQSDL